MKFVITVIGALFGLTATAQFTVEPPTTADPATPSDCTWWHIAVSADTCASIPPSYFITEHQFLSYNPSLTTSCGLIVGNSYCVERNWGIPPPETTTAATTPTTPPTTSAPPTSTTAGNSVTTPTPIQEGMTGSCNKFHLVEGGQGCWDIADSNGILLDDFYAWNPAVGTDCGGLWPDVYVCVGVLGSGTSSSTPTTTSAGNGITTPTPTQSGMTSSCNSFYFVQQGDGCFDIAADHAISLTDFYAWNPAVGNNCGGLWLDVYVCVGILGSTAPVSTTFATSTTSSSAGNGITTPTPTQAGMTSNCDDFYFVQQGDGCYDIAAAHGIALNDFYAWNQAVGNDCSGLWLNVYVCVGVIGGSTPTPTSTGPGNGVVTPTPTQSGMTGDCDEFYEVKSGDGCWDIANDNGISLDDFYGWNPAVGNNCGGLWPNYYVCVGVL